MGEHKPLIAVSTGFTDYGDYLGVVYSRPLARLGAVAVVVPYLETPAERAGLLERVGGLILGVGRDIEAARFGSAPHFTSTAHSPLRDAAEIELVQDALTTGVPVLGICRGMQVINVALGGTLHADHSQLDTPANSHPGGDWARWDTVVSAAVHGSPAPEHPTHPIEIAARSWLAAALGDAAVVNSYHHQSIATLGRGVQVTARAPDGVVEAIEVPSPTFCLGVQWELQEECAPGGNGERILRLFLAEATSVRRQSPMGQVA
ncbi:MAG: gamma-glutamyl-gamma-aminobutyrate hydrolase family protein [Solirubrobacteraceae bacterium]